eukprot:scaffold11045_cov138-Skeletonema_menzelii.AAC.14
MRYLIRRFQIPQWQTTSPSLLSDLQQEFLYLHFAYEKAININPSATDLRIASSSSGWLHQHTHMSAVPNDPFEGNDKQWHPERFLECCIIAA